MAFGQPLRFCDVDERVEKLGQLSFVDVTVAIVVTHVEDDAKFVVGSTLKQKITVSEFNISLHWGLGIGIVWILRPPPLGGSLSEQILSKLVRISRYPPLFGYRGTSVSKF